MVFHSIKQQLVKQQALEFKQSKVYTFML